MSGTIFNIFGDHLTNPVHKQVLRVNNVENSGVGKGALSSLTPARKPLGCCTPQASNVKKSFLQNRGALSVGKPCNIVGDVQKNIFKTVNRNLQIYEDNVSNLATSHPKLASEDKIIETEFTLKPYVDDDDYLSDSEAAVTEKNIDNMIFDIPDVGVFKPEYTPRMLDVSNNSSVDDILWEDKIDYLSLDNLELPDV